MRTGFLIGRYRAKRFKQKVTKSNKNNRKHKNENTYDVHD